MKKQWTAPRALIEQFLPNDYIAACTDTENTYVKFTCDVGQGYDVFVGGELSADGKKLTGTYTQFTCTEDYPKLDVVSSFKVCYTPKYVLESEAESVFLRGWIDSDPVDDQWGTLTPAITYIAGPNSEHVTKNLNIIKETVKGNKS